MFYTFADSTVPQLNYNFLQITQARESKDRSHHSSFQSDAGAVTAQSKQRSVRPLYQPPP